MGKFVALVVGLGLVLIFGIYFLSPHSPSTTKTAGMKTTEAVYRLDKTSVDFGIITVSDRKSTDFNFKNTGSEPIQLSHFQTSCDCTSAIVTIGETVSPVIGMAGMTSSEAANWQGEVPAGQAAIISVTYTPAKMPVYGTVERTTTFMANNNEVSLTVKAFVK